MLPARKLTWQNQSQFLQDRHGPGRACSWPEVIAVAMPACGEDARRAFDLLCWTINMAACPGDSVIALQQHCHGAVRKIVPGCAFKPNTIDSQFKPLQDLCDVKQVRLEMRITDNDVTEKLLLEEVSAINATMLVTISGHHSLRLARRRGSFLCRKVQSGCSIVIVKDYKVIFYEENHYREASRQRACTFSIKDGSQNASNLPLALHVERSHQLDPIYTACNKIWPDSTEKYSPRRVLYSSDALYHTEKYSPRRVLDSSDALYDSDDSLALNEYSGLSRSLSRKALVSYASSFHDEGDTSHIRKLNSCLGMWKGQRARVSRSHTFPSARRSKRALVFTHCKSLSDSFKSYMSSLWVARPLQGGNSMRKSIILAEKPVQIFTYEDILKATNLFNPDNLVGRGGHSEVYKGLLPKGQFVAVKRLIRGDTEEQKTIDFLTELGIVCHISHPNITPLVGFCIEKELHLIFCFVQHGSLASWLHGGKFPTLRWAIRYRVAVGTARGLNYLHSNCQRRIIHRDIKASNILLGPDFEPQITDFGLAKWLPDKCSHHISFPIEGTFGYLSPEYFMHGVYNEKTDVFAFGVLLLELITGHKPIESLQSNLVVWARPFLEAMNIEKLIDARLNGDYDPQEVQCVMMAAALCVQQSPQCRPCMSQVLQLLTDEITVLDGTNSLSALSSQSFCLQDLIFDSDYSSTNYHNDMRRHREIALQF